jgi:hypothetical protein
MSEVGCRSFGGSKQAHQPRYRGLFFAVTDIELGFVAVSGGREQRLMISIGGVFIVIGAVIIIIGITEGTARLPFGHFALVANCRLPAEVSC